MLPIAISSLVHYVYCPRQCALVWVDGVWTDNVHTTRGQRAHRRANQGGTRQERGDHVIRNVEVWSDTHELIGRCDAIAVSDHTVTPIEYKSGRAHEGGKIQLCAQALCLEEMFDLSIASGAIWSARTRRRSQIPFDTALRARTLDAIEQVKQLLHADQLPEPHHDQRCSECQLLGHCLPELGAGADISTSYLDRYVFGAVQ